MEMNVKGRDGEDGKERRRIDGIESGYERGWGVSSMET